MNPWWLVLTAGLGSFGFRIAMVAVVGRTTMPVWFDRASAFVAPTAFAGLVGVALVEPAGHDVGMAAKLWIAAGVTVIVARRRPTHLAMLAGLATLWACDLVSAGIGHVHWA